MFILLLHWMVSGLGLLLTAYFVPGFKVRSFGAALGASAAIGLANALVWPALFLITLPLNILTLGLFTFVLNGVRSACKYASSVSCTARPPAQAFQFVVMRRTIPTARRRMIAGTNHCLRREANECACGGVSFRSGISGLTQAARNCVSEASNE